MPIYEYQCADCSSEFELLVLGSDQPACPSCSGHKLEKLMSAPAAHSRDAALPICGESPKPAGGCGLPQCGQGRCAF